MSHASIAFDFLEPFDGESNLSFEIVLQYESPQRVSDLSLFLFGDVFHFFNIRNLEIIQEFS
jgi:hypothetical protein